MDKVKIIIIIFLISFLFVDIGLSKLKCDDNKKVIVLFCTPKIMNDFESPKNSIKKFFTHY